MGKLRKYTGQRFQVQISGSVGNYGNTWCCFFRCRILGSMDEKTQKTMEVHDTVFSWSLGKLRKYMALCFQVKGKTKEVHGAVFFRFSFQVLLENYGNAWSCFFRCRFWGAMERKKQRRKYMALYFQGLWENLGSAWRYVFRVYGKT